MKTTKTLIAVIISLLLTIHILPVSAFEADKTVASIVADDVTLYFESDGQWRSMTDEDGTYNGYAWFEYECEPQVTVFYSDGSSEQIAFYDLHKTVGHYPAVKTDQSAENEWGLGEHTVSFVCGDFTGDFTATIIGTPVTSVTVENPTIRQYVDGSYNANGYFIYYFNPLMTVTFQDGTVISGTRADISRQCGYQVYWSSDQPNDGEWDVGEHTAKAIFMGTHTPFTVTVIDVVADVELVQTPTQTVLPYGAYFDLSGGVLRVHFTDGRYEDVALDTRARYDIATLNKNVPLTLIPSYAYVSGTQEIALRFLGETVSYEAVVLPPPDNLTLTANADHSLTLVYAYEDKTLTWDVLAFSAESGRFSSNNSVTSDGTLYTTGGMFRAVLDKDGTPSTVWISLGSPYSEVGVYAVSNTIHDTHWFDRHNGILVYGDYNGDSETDTADVREMLKALASNRNDLNFYQIYTCDVNGNDELDTTDARTILKDVLA